MLELVSLPIGHPEDISLRSLRALKEADILIGEEPKAARKWLIEFDLREQIEKLYFLNEHSTEDDLAELASFVKEKKVVCFSDCGTPSFCDPAYKLVDICRKEGLEIRSYPGPSSLMQILSLTSREVKRFEFLGFLPREKGTRDNVLKVIANKNQTYIFMDTPYRFKEVIEALKNLVPNKIALIGVDLTKDTEQVYEGSISDIPSAFYDKKAEFICLVYG